MTLTTVPGRITRKTDHQVLLFAIAKGVLKHPGLWLTALKQMVVLARPDWWRRWPPLPVPDEKYLQFRIHTAYGEHDDDTKTLIERIPTDVVKYLQWCRRMRHIK